MTRDTTMQETRAAGTSRRASGHPSPTYRGRAWQEARSAVMGMPGRSAVAVIGLAVAVGLLIAVQSLVATVRYQVSDAFDAYGATTVTAVVDPTAPQALTAVASEHISRASAVPGVSAASRYADPSSGGVAVSASRAPGTGISGRVPVFAVDHGFAVAVDAQVTGAWLSERPDGMPVAVIGRVLADRIGLNERELGDRVLLIEGRPATIIGVIESAPRLRIAERSVLIGLNAPLLTAEQRQPRSIIVGARPGATAPVASVLATAMDPYHPEHFQVSRAWNGARLREDVDQLLVNLGWGATAVAGLVGAVVIAAHAAGSATARQGEIGLRRSLGARQRDIVGQFLCESILLGALAALVGVTAGVVGVLITCLANGWVPVVEPRALLLAPIGAVAVAALAGAAPAVRASRIDPSSALRR